MKPSEIIENKLRKMVPFKVNIFEIANDLNKNYSEVKEEIIDNILADMHFIKELLSSLNSSVGNKIFSKISEDQNIEFRAFLHILDSTVTEQEAKILCSEMTNSIKIVPSNKNSNLEQQGISITREEQMLHELLIRKNNLRDLIDDESKADVIMQLIEEEQENLISVLQTSEEATGITTSQLIPFTVKHIINEMINELENILASKELEKDVKIFLGNITFPLIQLAEDIYPKKISKKKKMVYQDDFHKVIDLMIDENLTETEAIDKVFNKPSYISTIRIAFFRYKRELTDLLDYLSIRISDPRERFSFLYRLNEKKHKQRMLQKKM